LRTKTIPRFALNQTNHLMLMRPGKDILKNPTIGSILNSGAGMILGATLGTILFGLPIGFLIGYVWRDRLSRARRARYLIEHERRKLRKMRSVLDMEVLPLAPRDDMF
jgi:hypothetical protein